MKQMGLIGCRYRVLFGVLLAGELASACGNGSNDATGDGTVVPTGEPAPSESTPVQNDDTGEGGAAPQGVSGGVSAPAPLGGAGTGSGGASSGQFGAGGAGAPPIGPASGGTTSEGPGSGGAVGGGAVGGGAVGGAVGQGAAGDNTVGGGAQPSLGAGPCPASAPTIGEPCAVDVACSYGTSVFPECREYFSCLLGSWSTARVTSGLCAENILEDCPAEHPVGSCATPGSACIYDDAICRCLAERSEVCSGDGCETLPQPIPQGWRCDAPRPDCPLSPPNAGQPCAAGSQGCVFGGDCGGVLVACRDGLWNWELHLCP